MSRPSPTDPTTGAVVPFRLLQAKRALVEAGADAYDLSDAMVCYGRAVNNGQTADAAVIWCLRFFYLLTGATRQTPEGLSAQEAVRAAYERVICDRAITTAATLSETGAAR